MISGSVPLCPCNFNVIVECTGVPMTVAETLTSGPPLTLMMTTAMILTVIRTKALDHRMP